MPCIFGASSVTFTSFAFSAPCPSNHCQSHRTIRFLNPFRHSSSKRLRVMLASNSPMVGVVPVENKFSRLSCFSCRRRFQNDCCSCKFHFGRSCSTARLCHIVPQDRLALARMCARTVISYGRVVMNLYHQALPQDVINSPWIVEIQRNAASRPIGALPCPLSEHELSMRAQINFSEFAASTAVSKQLSNEPCLTSTAALAVT